MLHASRGGGQMPVYGHTYLQMSHNVGIPTLSSHSTQLWTLNKSLRAPSIDCRHIDTSLDSSRSSTSVPNRPMPCPVQRVSREESASFPDCHRRRWLGKNGDPAVIVCLGCPVEVVGVWSEALNPSPCVPRHFWVRWSSYPQARPSLKAHVNYNF